MAETSKKKTAVTESFATPKQPVKKTAQLHTASKSSEVVKMTSASTSQAAKKTSNVNSNPKSDSLLSFRTMVFVNGVLIIMGSFLVIMSIFYLGLKIIEKSQSLDERLSTLEQKVDKIDSVPSKTRNLLIYGDENSSTEKPKSTSISNEPVLGNLNSASVGIVAYSDANCPYCKRFAAESLPQIINDYVNTGKVVFIHKDFPSVGGQDSIDAQAVAACVDQQKDDRSYYSFLQDLYALEEKATLESSIKLAKDKHGLGEAQLRSCASDQSIRSEIQEDLQEASSLGFQGTPSFIIGKVVDGQLVEGEEVIGAQPYNVFQQTLDKYLQ